jgi:hypothetical protein
MDGSTRLPNIDEIGAFLAAFLAVLVTAYLAGGFALERRAEQELRECVAAAERAQRSGERSLRLDSCNSDFQAAPRFWSVSNPSVRH